METYRTKYFLLQFLVMKKLSTNKEAIGKHLQVNHNQVVVPKLHGQYLGYPPNGRRETK